METQRLIDIDAVDLESGMDRVMHQEDEAKDVGSSGGQGRKLLNGGLSPCATFDRFTRGDDAVKSGNATLGQAEFPVAIVEAFLDGKDGGEEMASLLKNKMRVEKTPKKGSKKPPKPPRPPNSPSLDAADQKMIREISELVMAKRARVERMKKRINNTKSSSNGNFCALVVTILFCLVIIWQGAFSRGNSKLRFHGAPESSKRSGGQLISVPLHKNASVNDPNMPYSASLNNVEN